MLNSHTTKVLALVFAGTTIVATLGEASTHNRYTHGSYGRHYHRGVGAGPVIAGAALGVLGAAAAGVAADRYYNGYPAYSYGPGYGSAYGYDYHPGYGYYGPY